MLTNRIPARYISSDKPQVLALLEAIPRRADVEVLHPGDGLCDEQQCATYLEGTFIYRDEGHFSYEGAALVSERMDWLGQVRALAR